METNWPEGECTEYEIHAFEAALRADFLRLHDERNGLGWCRCVAWWVPSFEGWGERTAEQNLALRDELCARGECDGLLAYAGGEPVGWCQCGPRDRLPGIRSAFAGSLDPDVWAVTCFAVAPEYRGRGVAHALLSAALAQAAERGASAIEGFPRRDEPGVSEEEWTGPLALFRAHGFEVAHDSGAGRIVVRRGLGQ